MTTNAPRRSALAGASPSKPSEPISEPQTAPADPTPSSEGEKPRRGRPVSPGGKKQHQTFYMSATDKKRAHRAQVAWRLHNEEITTMSQYVEYAVMKLTKELEAEYNESKPF